jgi:glutathione-regulated potassium-efflux system ancillary protein KefC/glutathione-regulated potassium-efflux system protein KefB
MNIQILILILLLASVVIVPISYKFKLGGVLGYLLAGLLVGPHVLGLVKDTAALSHVAEFGVIFLLFIIGLELEPKRLWTLRKTVFGTGLAQVFISVLLICVLLIAFGFNFNVSLLLGIGLALSSTALVLQSLSERGEITSQVGRDAFGVLLFQDLAAIPVLSLLPLLFAQNSEHHLGMGWVLLFLILFVVVSSFALRPFFGWVSQFHSRELFTTATLFVVVVSATVMHLLGLSMALGSFIAGMLLAGSEYKHELEADIEPFKGLLLGLFFMTIGMTANLGQILEQPVLIFGLVVALFAIKIAAMLLVQFRLLKEHFRASLRLAIYLCQGGEFAFVLFALGTSLGILNREISDTAVIVVTLSMLISPLLFVLADRFLKSQAKVVQRDFDKIDQGSPVIIAGFGRFGQIAARILATRKIPFTALEKSAEHVDFVRRFGNKIYYGDASRLELLHSAKTENAKAFVLAIDDVQDSLKTAEMVRKHFPHVPIYARARNRQHAFKLLDLKVKVLQRETFLSSVSLSAELLKEFGLSSEEIYSTIDRFTKYDEDLLFKQHSVYKDEAKLIEASKQALQDLENLFESDRHLDFAKDKPSLL